MTITTRPGHVQYGELLLGPGTPYRWRKLTGWEELPGTDSGTVPRSGAHGAYPGALLAQARTITLDEMVIRAEPGRIGAAVATLNAATGLSDDELPLLIHLDDRGPLLAFARVVRREVPVDPAYGVGVATGSAIQFEASDPRRYTPAVQCAETGLPEPCLDWHRDNSGELTRGIPASTGNLTANNHGGAPTHPVITIRGPVDTPSVTNTTTGAVLEYGIRLDAVDELTIDTYASTVTLNGTENLLDAATGNSHPEESFTLTPGRNRLAFRSATAPDPHARLALQWRSAHW
ncbi:phage tail domain-containing protein [Streptomyces sp. XD-27]|uniref:phage distal tail protein n=1 Tax=Streptomyces sp. XD-27 TaxID=3062779 RepID=UPI0026F4269C|nr:phage tail domain-containing protein [Streptomyces sp. XD-27]WKX70053.1 phage tail family protein [Streptomyces sp. XD-27]